MIKLEVLDAKLAAAKRRREKREAVAASEKKLRDDVEDLKRRGLLLSRVVLEQGAKVRALKAEVQTLREHLATLKPKPANDPPRRRRDGLDAEMERALYNE